MNKGLPNFLPLICLLMVASPSWGRKSVEPILHSQSVRQASTLRAFDYSLLPQFNGPKVVSSVRIESPNQATWESPYSNPETRRQNHEILLANGAGTRGGGSGILKKGVNGQNEVLLLDLYRDSDVFNGFSLEASFASEDLIARSRLIDSRFLTKNQKPLFSSQKSRDERESAVEQASEEILKDVINRLEGIFPVLGHRLNAAHKDLSFSKWTPTLVELPIIKDFGSQLSLREGESQVQIAYRRATKVIYHQGYYEMMDAIHRAALKLHELVYAISGFKESENIQIFVQLAMSSALNDEDGKLFAKALIQSLHLSYLLVSTLELPAGVEQIEPVGPNAGVVCGMIKKMKIQDNPIQLDIQIDFDEQHPQITHHTFLFETYSGDFEKMISELPKLTQQKQITVTGPEAKNLLLSLYNFKFYFSTQFPLFLYPTQFNPADILCVGEDDQLQTVSSALLYKAKANNLELVEAESEAKYFEIYEAYRCDPSPMNSSALDLMTDLLRGQRERRRTLIEKDHLYKSVFDVLDTKALSIRTVQFRSGN